jgi:hypothetical protein
MFLRGVVGAALALSAALSWPLWRDAGREELPLFPFVASACRLASLFPLLHLAAAALLALLVARPRRSVLLAWLAGTDAVFLSLSFSPQLTFCRQCLWRLCLRTKTVSCLGSRSTSCS